MRANQLMSKEVVCLRPIETVEAIMTILRDYDHNCFPVVEDRDQRVLLGVVYRYECSSLCSFVGGWWWWILHIIRRQEYLCLTVRPKSPADLRWCRASWFQPLPG